MSEPMISTGKTRESACPKCGVVIVEKEYVGAFGQTGSTWTRSMHDAPCGTACWGAGVRVTVYREKQVHGHDKYPCPGCQRPAPGWEKP